MDVAESAGLAAFVHTDGGSGRKFFVEQMGSGVAMLDYDADGWQDLYFCSGQPLPGYEGPKPSNRLFRNRGDGTFEEVTEKAGVGDPRLSSSAAFGDYNGDGYLDLYVANYVKWSMKNDLYCSKFAGHKTYCGPTLYDPEEHSLYRNRGDGTFEDVSVKAGIRKARGNGLAVVWLDYDDDNDQDIFVADDQSPNLLWRNNGDGTFTEAAMDVGVAVGEQGNAQAGMGVDAGDFDNDGWIDLIVTYFSEETNGLYHNEKGLFRDISYPSGMGVPTLLYLGFGTGFIDYDRDGWLDLFFANGHVLDDIEMYSDAVTWKQSNQLFRNKGDGTFEETSAATGISEGKRVSRGAAFGDLFNRGRTDIVVNVLRERPLLLKNECAPESHYLQLDLRASWGNPQAIGAKVWLTAGGRTQRRDVKSGGSYASSSDLRPLFGLGQTTAVEELKIRWPSGQETIMKGPPIDRMLRVDEPPLKERKGS